ncbi:MAG: Rpn family recombination-promoting nuclease/putative transposase [Synergistes sp.]|nr:Rpn family recombination-promoting nuclease/putative transposase [Synergistes sp.]
MGAKDAVEKSLFSYNDVFCNICNAVISHGRKLIDPDDLTDAVPSSTHRFGDDIHGQERDIAKYWQNGQIRIALIGIENQTSYDPDMPIRILCYDAAAYRAQLSDKGHLKRGEYRYPAVTIVLNFSTRQRWKNKNLVNRLKIPKDLRPFVSDYKINVIDLAWLNDEEISHFHGDMRFLVEYLSAARQDKDFNPSDETTEHFDELIQVFSQLSGIKYHEAVNIFTEEEKRKGGVPMNKVLKRMFANARAEGKTEGIEEGIGIGEARGASKLARLISCLLKAGRPDDALSASEDEAARDRFFVEFGIA